MDQIRDCDIGRLWQEHYPKSQHSGTSKCLCTTLALMLEDKAQAMTTGDEDLIENLYIPLQHFKVPRDQFYEVEKEIGDA